MAVLYCLFINIFMSTCPLTNGKLKLKLTENARIYSESRLHQACFEVLGT